MYYVFPKRFNDVNNFSQLMKKIFYLMLFKIGKNGDENRFLKEIRYWQWAWSFTAITCSVQLIDAMKLGINKCYDFQGGVQKISTDFMK